MAKDYERLPRDHARVIMAIVEAAARGATTDEMIAALDHTGGAWATFVVSRTDLTPGLKVEAAMVAVDLKRQPAGLRHLVAEDVRSLVEVAFSSLWQTRASVQLLERHCDIEVG